MAVPNEKSPAVVKEMFIIVSWISLFAWTKNKTKKPSKKYVDREAMKWWQLEKTGRRSRYYQWYSLVTRDHMATKRWCLSLVSQVKCKMSVRPKSPAPLTYPPSDFLQVSTETRRLKLLHCNNDMTVWRSTALSLSLGLLMLFPLIAKSSQSETQSKKS